MSLELLRQLLIARFGSRTEQGATAVEYGLLVALVAAVIVVGVTAFGSSVSGLYDTLTLVANTI